MKMTPGEWDAYHAEMEHHEAEVNERLRKLEQRAKTAEVEVKRLRVEVSAETERAASWQAACQSAYDRFAEAEADRDRARDIAVALEQEVAQLQAKLDGPCGSCHPCVNYSDETWRAAGRKPPHVYEWDEAQAAEKRVRAYAEVCGRSANTAYAKAGRTVLALLDGEDR